MIGEADEIGIERLDDRIEVPQTSDEVQHLAVTLNSMLARLERGLEDKRRFVADASHELRTPLAVMRSELEVSLRSDDLTPSARSALESAQEEVERMRAIVENLLTLARVDAGELQLFRSPEDFRAIVDSVTASASVIAHAHGVTLVAQGPAARVDADRTRIEQVLTNLLANAIRFSPAEGTVTAVTWIADGEAGCTITDEGPGVPQEVMPRVFERFVRADPSRAGDGGSGLGLAICREIVKAHGGRIWLDTPPGGGSAFSFAIPRSDRFDEAHGDPGPEGVPEPARQP
jgi:two-component system OmpR family sensor kinase